jgi:hypothetical protein
MHAYNECLVQYSCIGVDAGSNACMQVQVELLVHGSGERSNVYTPSVSDLEVVLDQIWVKH